MPALSVLCIAAVVAWAVLVVIAQVMTPEQSPLSMGMSGLARGPHGWLMKAAFIARGAAALFLVAAIPLAVPAGARSTVGLALLWVWGLGSALLAVYSTDMLGEEPTGKGKAHALIAAVAYVCAVIGMIAVSLALYGDEAAAGVGRWSLVLALAAAAALAAQFAGFATAARDAAAERKAKEAGDVAARAGGGAAGETAAATPAAPPVPLPLTLSVARPASAAPSRALGGLGDMAGLLQRLFLALVMLWTAVVAAAI